MINFSSPGAPTSHWHVYASVQSFVLASLRPYDDRVLTTGDATELVPAQCSVSSMRSVHCAPARCSVQLNSEHVYTVLHPTFDPILEQK